MSVIGQQKIKTLSCHLCNMFGMEYRGGVSKEHHTKSKCHIFMKNFWENGLWPGPPHKANSQQLTPQIFSFHYEKVSDDPSSKSRGGLILCRLCDEICLDAVGLYQHQSDVKHARMLEKLKLASSHAILRLCPICNQLIACGPKYVAHAESHEKFSARKSPPRAQKSLPLAQKSSTPAPPAPVLMTTTTAAAAAASATASKTLAVVDNDETEILPLLNLILEKNLLQENLENRQVDLILEILSRKTKNAKTNFLIRHLLESRSERRDRERRMQSLLQNVAVDDQPSTFPAAQNLKSPSTLMNNNNQSMEYFLSQILAGNNILQNVSPAQSSFPSSSSHFIDYVSRAEIAGVGGQRFSTILPPPTAKFANVLAVSKEEIDRQMQKLLAKPSYDFVFDGDVNRVDVGDRRVVDVGGKCVDGSSDDALPFFMTSRASQNASAAAQATKKWRKEEEGEKIQKPPYVKARNRLARSEHWSLEKEKIERLLTSSPVDLPSTASADGDVPALISDVSDQDDDEINLEYSGDNNRIDLFYNDDSAQNRRKYSDPDFKNRDNFENRDDDDDVVTLSGGLEAISDDDDDDAERKPQPQRRCVLRDDRRGYSKNERLRHRRRRPRDDVDRLNKKRRGE